MFTKKLILILLAVFLGYLTAFFTKPDNVKIGFWDILKFNNPPKNFQFISSSDSLHYTIAKNLLEKRDFFSALQKFSLLWEKGNRWDSISLGIARAYWGLDSNSLALPWIDSTMKYNPENYEALTLKARISIANESYEEALDNANEALSINSDYAPALVEKAYALYFIESTTSKAENVLREVDNIDSLNVRANYLKALIHIYQHDTVAGLSFLQKCIDLDPYFVSAYAERGYIYLDFSDSIYFRKAIQDYQKALTLPKAIKYIYLMNIGVAYSYLGKIDSTFYFYQKSIDINPDYYLVYFNRGYLYYNDARYKEALTDLSKAIELNPDYSNAYTYRGIVYYNKTDYIAALNDFYSALEADPNNTIVIYDIALTHENLGNTQDALDMYQRYINEGADKDAIEYARNRVAVLSLNLEKKTDNEK